MDYHIVVAKYKEDISWLQEMDKSHIYLYDKGFTENSINGFAHYEQRPNIGRESETYLYHIIKHYDNLPDFLILLLQKTKIICEREYELANAISRYPPESG